MLKSQFRNVVTDTIILFLNLSKNNKTNEKIHCNAAYIFYVQISKNVCRVYFSFLKNGKCNLLNDKCFHEADVRNSMFSPVSIVISIIF